MASQAGFALLALLVSFWFTHESAGADFRVPSLTSAVVDEAGMLSPTSRSHIESALRALRDQGGTQLAVLTIPSLQGLTIEQVSIRVVDQWKLGSESQDDGVLLMVAQAERGVRIEVGQGLEGVLTDAHSKRIIDESIRPLFRAGDFGGGITLGVFEIAKRTNPKIDLRPHLEGALRRPPARKRDRGGFGLLAVLLLFSTTLARVGSFGAYSRRRRYLWGGAIGSGIYGSGVRGGFGGGFSGGFSGAGGGFSGGGASGGW